MENMDEREKLIKQSVFICKVSLSYNTHINDKKKNRKFSRQHAEFVNINAFIRMNFSVLISYAAEKC